MGKNYGAIDHLGLITGGTLADFVCVRSEPVYRRDKEQVTDEVGEHLPTTLHVFNEVIGYEAEYECKVRTAVNLEFLVGNDDAMHITQIVVQLVNKKYARVLISAHEHPVANFGEHLDNERTITIPTFNGFGATDLVDGIFTETDVQNATYMVTIGHVDDQDNVGEHLVGRSQGETHECTMGAITDALPPDPTAPWKLTEKKTPRLNSGHYRAMVSVTQLVAGP